ncbi:MAG: 50S ribosomal protein L11 methyltransferase [Bdellovibrionales bacterium]
MFQAILIVPAAYRETDIADLCGGIECLAQSALRSENHDQSPWRIEWLFEDAPDLKSLKAALILNAGLHGVNLPSPLEIMVEAVPQRDWLSYSYQQFPAFAVGDFFIYGSHHDGEVPDGALGLQIDAATAFGSGEHPTTKGCLQAMLDLKDQGLCPWNILDMGTGSGILALAAWKLWKTPVLGIDNDDESVRVSKRHQGFNAIPDEVVFECGDGFAAQAVGRKKPFELIIANILAGPLKEMAADLAAVVDDNGYVILSGILNEQAEDVLKTYAGQNLILRQHIKIKDWSTLILQAV